MTYDELVARLKAFLEDDYTEFSSSIDTMIEHAELQIAKELEVDAMIQHETGALTLGTATVDKPNTAIVSVRSFTITVNGKKVPLFMRQKSFLDAFWPDATKKDTPRFYANYDEDTWQVAPTPKAAYAFSAETVQRITGLSSSTTTTWISLNHPDLLFYAVCLQGGVFDQDSEDGKRYAELYERALTGARAEVDRVRSDLNSILRVA